MKMIKGAGLRIKLFFTFLRWCWEYPDSITENWQDMKSRYLFETDPEMNNMLKEIQEDISNR